MEGGPFRDCVYKRGALTEATKQHVNDSSFHSRSMAAGKEYGIKSKKKGEKDARSNAPSGSDRMREQALRKLKKDSQRLRNETNGIVQELEGVKKEIESINEIVRIHSENASDVVRFGEMRNHEVEERYTCSEVELNKTSAELYLTKQVLADEKRRNEELRKIIEEKALVSEENKRFADRIEEQESTLEGLTLQLQRQQEREVELETEKTALVDENKQLLCKIQSGSQLKMIHKNPWYFRKSCFKIHAPANADLDGATVVSVGQNMLVVLGARSKDNVNRVLSLCPGDLYGFKCVIEKSNFPGRYHHSCNFIPSVGLVVFGGRNSDLLSSKVLVYDGKREQWSPFSGHMTDIPQLECHCTVSWGTCLFIYGGLLADGRFNGELYFLEFEKAKGSILNPSTPIKPKPRKNAAVAVTDDGLMLWMFGGQSDDDVLDDLYTFDVEKRKWEQQVEHTGVRPQARAGHACRYSQGYLLVSGGYTKLPSGESSFLLDTWVLDTGMMKWYKVDDGTFLWQCNNVQSIGHQFFYTHNFDAWGSLNIVTASRDGNIDKLIILDMIFGDNLDQDLDDQGDEIRSSRLEFLEKCESGATFIDLTWRPPERNADRIEHFKLMAANNLGVVKEVYRGKLMHFRVKKLRPNTEYIFCLKAVYADGSYVWSDPSSFKTRHGEKD